MIHADTIGVAYWEKRAATAEEKVKDWSARAVQLQAELATTELDRGMWHDTCQKAEERIRELEANRDAFQDLAEEKAKRIAKAKAILEAAKPFNGASIFDIDAALKALDGK